jgi:hypothetical protein
MKKTKIAIMVLSLFIYSFAQVSSAYAASVYDNAVQISRDTSVSNGQLSTDASSISQFFENTSYGTSCNTARLASWNNSLSQGSQSQTILYGWDGITVDYSIKKQVITWTDDDNLGTNAPDFYYSDWSSKSQFGFSNYSFSGAHSMVVIYEGNSLKAYCEDHIQENSISSSTMSRKVIYSNYDLAYPFGYAGEPIPSSPIPRLLKGSVQCANSSNVISAVQIDSQNGSDGNAAISTGSNGATDYEYVLPTEGPYSIIVLCDGDPFYSPTVDINLYDQYNWACTTEGESGVCAAA